MLIGSKVVGTARYNRWNFEGAVPSGRQVVGGSFRLLNRESLDGRGRSRMMQANRNLRIQKPRLSIHE